VSELRRARWGFHRLDDEWARRLVACARLGRGDLVLDIGAGTGALTRPLAATGARVVAIEAHPRRVAELRTAFGDARVKVVRADATDLRLPTRPFHVVANPPFAIITAVLRRLTSPHSRLVRAQLVVPRHVAARWANGRGPGHGRWGLTFAAEVTGHVPRRAFRPSPPEPAAVLTIERRR
jgi:23S rRNA (adenine-N6)-dimethyltransferase